jgi:Domain of unknown function (DUF222)
MQTRETPTQGQQPEPTDEPGSVADLPAERLEATIVGLARRLSAGTYELLVLVGELDRRGTWARWGALSCAAWLAEACDIEAATARTQVRVARAIREFPALDAAMADGDVSYAKARVLVPHLTHTNVEVLVGLASATPAGRLGQAIAAWSAGHEDPADIERRHLNERSVTWRVEADGMVVTTIRQPPADAAVLHAALDHHVRTRRHPRDTAPAGASAARPTLRQQRSEALLALLTTGSRKPTTEIVVHIRGDEPALLADGTPLNNHAVTALLPDAFVSLLLHDTHRYPIDASPRRRHPTRRQRRVNDERHPHCALDGCRCTEFLQHDHDKPYTRGGPTVLANLQKLCGPHNRAKGSAG